MRLLKVATCNLNQWSMDFDTNLNNIKESIVQAKQAGAVIRLGPELEITGYGCEDHFLEPDTVTHSWECLKEILVSDLTDGILCSIGMPIIKGSEPYNCQVLCMNRKIIMMRPKMRLPNGDNFMEFRYFKPWKKKHQIVDFQLPNEISEAISQKSAPFGYGYIQFLDTAVAAEVCRELFSTFPPHDDLALNGVEIFLNASGSYHQLRKAFNFRFPALIGITRSLGGVYMYSNQRGCDGGRLYYDGCSCILVNGEVVALASQFSLKDVEVAVAQIDLDTVTAKRRSSTSTFLEEPNGKTSITSVAAPYNLCKPFSLKLCISKPIEINPCTVEEEIALGPACWLWDYLRRSGACGFLLPLSGEQNSSAVAAIVGCMCQLVVKDIANGNEQVKADAIRIGGYADEEFPEDSKEFARRIFYTAFMGSENSSEGRRRQAKALAEEIGSWHLDIPIDSVVSAIKSLLLKFTRKGESDKEKGSSDDGNRRMKSVESRIRMVLALTLASLLPWTHHKLGSLLVLSSSNVNEELSGQITKYGSSSADINPIGSINHKDIQSFLKWAATGLGYPSLAEAEVDETELGMTNEELSIYGKLRKKFRCGPVSMFENLCHKWASTVSPSEVADKVKKFFKHYAMNRHKMTVLTPFYNAEDTSPDDNRCDLRQFLYNKNWSFQFQKIDQLLLEVDGNSVDVAGLSDHEKLTVSLNGLLT